MSSLDDFCKRSPPEAYKARICAFVDVRQPKIKEGAVTVMDRHSEKPPEGRKTPSADKVFIPISDTRIRRALEQNVVPHPYTLLGLLEEWVAPSAEEVADALSPLHLYVHPRDGNTALIPQLARIYGREVDSFLRLFRGNINNKIIQDSWRQIFENSKIDQEEADRQLRFFQKNLVSGLPTADFALREMDDMYKLHVLACAMNTRMYLILIRAGGFGRDEPRFGLFPKPSILCLPIGPAGAHEKYSMFIVVKSSTEFLIAEPQFKEKVVAKNKEDEGSLLKTFETMDEKMAVYYRYATTLDQDTESDTPVETIRTVTVEKNTNAPEMTMERKDDVLEITVDLPFFNKDNDKLLTALLESISDERDERTVESAEGDMTLMCKNVVAVSSANDNGQKLVITRKSRGKQTLNDLHEVRSESVLNAVAKAVSVARRHAFYEGPEGSLLGLYAFRLLAAEFSGREWDSFLSEVPPSSLPLFTPNVSRATLAEYAECAYAELLCHRSILRYAIGETTRTCPNCGKEQDPGKLMLCFRPRRGQQEELTWSCHQCLLKRQRQRGSEGETKGALLRMVDEFPYFKNLKSAAELQPVLELYNNNIEAFKSNPDLMVGYLREMRSHIDNAFSTFQTILSSYYLPVATMNITAERQKERRVYLDAMMGMKDQSEVDVQLEGRAEKDTNFPVDFRLFSQYLSWRSDIEQSWSQFRLVRRPSSVLLDLEDAFADALSRRFEPDQGSLLSSFYLRIQKEREFGVDFQFSDEIGEMVCERYQYDVYPIVSTSHLSVSSIASILTDMIIVNIWELDADLLVLAHEPLRTDDSRYARTFLYVVPRARVSLAAIKPIYEFDGEISVLEYAYSNSKLAIAFETSEAKCVRLITILQNGLPPSVELPPPNTAQSVTSLAFGPDDTLYMSLEGGCILRWGEEEKDSDWQVPADIVKLVGTNAYIVAIDSEGNVYRESCPMEEEEEEEDGACHFNKIPNFPGLACPIFPYTMNQKNGILIFPRLPLQSSDDRARVTFHSTRAAPEPFVGRIASVPQRQVLSKQLGMIVNECSEPNRQIWNVHLSIAEFLPALVAYEHRNRIYCVKNDMSHFYPARAHLFMPAAVKAFYARSVNAISLHHIEEVIMSHGLRVNIIGFMPLIDSGLVASVIDTIFGTRFACVEIPGIWVGMRVVGDVAHVIIFFRALKHEKLQLMALYRGANVIELCTTKLINTLDFVYEWQNEGEKRGWRQVLSEKTAKPNIQVSLFMPRGKSAMNETAVREHIEEKGIAASVKPVPFREDWNTETFEDDEGDVSELFTVFKENWECLLNLQEEEESLGAEYRKPYETMRGIGIAKQIIATYLTLVEFDDIPSVTTLQYCKLAFELSEID